MNIPTPGTAALPSKMLKCLCGFNVLDGQKISNKTKTTDPVILGAHLFTCKNIIIIFFLLFLMEKFVDTDMNYCQGMLSEYV